MHHEAETFHMGIKFKFPMFRPNLGREGIQVGGNKPLGQYGMLEPNVYFRHVSRSMTTIIGGLLCSPLDCVDRVTALFIVANVNNVTHTDAAPVTSRGLRYLAICNAVSSELCVCVCMCVFRNHCITN